MPAVPVPSDVWTPTLPSAGPPLQLSLAPSWLLAVPLLALAVGVWVYVDARSRDREEWAPLLGIIVGGLFLTGSVPGVIALLVAADPATQGFPTALRIVPGVVALAVYLSVR